MALNKQLDIACKYGSLEWVKILVNKGVDVNKSFKHYYPIEIVSLYGRLEVMRYLYSIGCDPTIQNNIAIIHASKKGYLEIVKYLYSIGCDPTAHDNCAIRTASYYGELEVVKYLYSIGCDPTVDNNSAIINASNHGYLETVKFLVTVGCDNTVIKNKQIKKKVELWLNEPKLIFNKCLERIYGHPDLERTKTENLLMFNKFN